MKTTGLFTIIILLTMTSFTQESATLVSSHEVAARVVEALRKSSADQYMTLIPTLSDFDRIMEENGTFYGNYLEDARAEFAGFYVSELLPSARESFESILSEGDEQGIAWSEVHYEGVEVSHAGKESMAASALTILFSSEGKQYRLQMDDALVIHGNWNASHKLRIL